jgi:hypothetical protein
MTSLLVLAACVLAGLAFAAVSHLRKFEERQRELKKLKPHVTLQAKLAPGITDAAMRLAQGHAKLAPQLNECGAQSALRFDVEYEDDMSKTATYYYRVSPDKADILQGAYASYFPGGELCFFEGPEATDPFRAEHAGLIAPGGHHHPHPYDEHRLRVLEFLRAHRLGGLLSSSSA